MRCSHCQQSDAVSQCNLCSVKFCSTECFEESEHESICGWTWNTPDVDLHSTARRRASPDATLHVTFAEPTVTPRRSRRLAGLRPLSRPEIREFVRNQNNWPKIMNEWFEAISHLSFTHGVLFSRVLAECSEESRAQIEDTVLRIDTRIAELTKNIPPITAVLGTRWTPELLFAELLSARQDLEQLLDTESDFVDTVCREEVKRKRRKEKPKPAPQPPRGKSDPGRAGIPQAVLDWMAQTDDNLKNKKAMELVLVSGKPLNPVVNVDNFKDHIVKLLVDGEDSEYSMWDWFRGALAGGVREPGMWICIAQPIDEDDEEDRARWLLRMMGQLATSTFEAAVRILQLAVRALVSALKIAVRAGHAALTWAWENPRFTAVIVVSAFATWYLGPGIFSAISSATGLVTNSVVWRIASSVAWHFTSVICAAGISKTVFAMVLEQAIADLYTRGGEGALSTNTSRVVTTVVAQIITFVLCKWHGIRGTLPPPDVIQGKSTALVVPVKTGLAHPRSLMTVQSLDGRVFLAPQNVSSTALTLPQAPLGIDLGPIGNDLDVSTKLLSNIREIRMNNMTEIFPHGAVYDLRLPGGPPPFPPAQATLMLRSELPAYLGDFVDAAEKYEGALTDAGGFYENGLAWDSIRSLPGSGPDPALIKAAGGLQSFRDMTAKLGTPIQWLAAAVLLGLGQSVSV